MTLFFCGEPPLVPHHVAPASALPRHSPTYLTDRLAGITHSSSVFLLGVVIVVTTAHRTNDDLNKRRVVTDAPFVDPSASGINGYGSEAVHFALLLLLRSQWWRTPASV